jgi:hypothetical protein
MQTPEGHGKPWMHDCERINMCNEIRNAEMISGEGRCVARQSTPSATINDPKATLCRRAARARAWGPVRRQGGELSLRAALKLRLRDLHLGVGRGRREAEGSRDKGHTTRKLTEHHLLKSQAE